MAAPTDVQVTSAGTTTIHTLPASNPAGVTDNHALPFQGVTGGVPVSISAVSLPLPTGAAQDGTDGTGIAPPAGGAGIRGWLSGIFNKLNTSIAVTGTFWQTTQPVSAASLPLPAGAATAAKQPAFGTAGTPSADVITVQGHSSGTPQPISGTVAATQSGAWTVQPGNTANTTPWLVADSPASIATGQVTIANTATLIASSRAGRRSITIVNEGTSVVRIGTASVTTGNGVYLPNVIGATITLDGGAAVSGIVASGTNPISFVESF